MLDDGIHLATVTVASPDLNQSIDIPVSVTITNSDAYHDLTGDGMIGVGDYEFVRDHLGTHGADDGYDYHADIDRDGDVDQADLQRIIDELTGGCSLVVTHTGDSGPGSLRDAIACSNQYPSSDRFDVTFRLSSDDPNFIDIDAGQPKGDSKPDVFVISPLSALPAMTRGSIGIRGDSQLAVTGDTNPLGPEIVIVGAQAGFDADGLVLRSSGNLIQSLNVQQFAGNGILIEGDANEILGNYIGSGPRGDDDQMLGQPSANGLNGVSILNGSGNTIGGPPSSRFDGGGVGPYETMSIGPGHLLHIGDARLDVLSYQWSAYANSPFGDSDSSGETTPGDFLVTLPVDQAGGLFVDLASGRSLGDVVLNSISMGESPALFQSWTLQNTHVVNYDILDSLDAQFAFSFDAIETSIYPVDGNGNSGAPLTSRWELGGDVPVTSGGGPGPRGSQSTGAGDLMHIGGHVIDVFQIEWNASANLNRNTGATQLFPGVFEVTAEAHQVGALFVDLAEGRPLGDVVLNQTTQVTDLLYNSWTLVNARVVSYTIEEDFEPGSDPTVHLAFGFDAIESSIALFDGDRIVDRKDSRWVTGTSPDPSFGGGPGPDRTRSTGAGDLLQIGDTVLDVYQHSWFATGSGSSVGPRSAQASAGSFVILTDYFQAGALFVDLAEGRSLGDILMTSSALSGQDYQGLLYSWGMENARVVHYQLQEHGVPGTSPLVELAFEFDAIESTVVQLDSRASREIGRKTSRWDFSGDDPSTTGGGAGPYDVRGASKLLQIGSTGITVEQYSWNANAAFEFGSNAGVTSAYPGVFSFVTDIYQAAGLFVDLAEGRSLGDVVFLASDLRNGELLRRWELANAYVVDYFMSGTDDPQSLTNVEFSLSFDAIESTFISRSAKTGAEINRVVSRWEIAGDAPIITSGGPGPWLSPSTYGELLHIGDLALMSTGMTGKQTRSSVPKYPPHSSTPLLKGLWSSPTYGKELACLPTSLPVVRWGTWFLNPRTVRQVRFISPGNWIMPM